METINELVPFFFPTKGGVSSKTLGNLTFALRGLLSIGPHSFHHTESIDFEYAGFHIFRAVGSYVVKVTTPTGEVFLFHYSALHSTWSEVRTFEKPSLIDVVKYQLREVFDEFGPVLCSLMVGIAAATGAYMWLLGTGFTLLCRSWLYVVLFIVASGVGEGIFAQEQGRKPKPGDEPMVHAYAAPVAVVLALIVQVPIAAWNNRSLFTWRTVRAAGLRLLFVCLLVSAGTWFHLRTVSPSCSPLLQAWGPLLGHPVTEPWENPADAEIQRRLDELERQAKALGVF